MTFSTMTKRFLKKNLILHEESVQSRLQSIEQDKMGRVLPLVNKSIYFFFQHMTEDFSIYCAPIFFHDDTHKRTKSCWTFLLYKISFFPDHFFDKVFDFLRIKGAES